MTDITHILPVVGLRTERRVSEWQRAMWRLRRNPLSILGIVLVVLALLCALIAPLIAPYDPILGNLRDHLQGPSVLHTFGTDNLGRDVFTRVLYGSQISLEIALAVQVLTLLLGLLLAQIHLILMRLQTVEHLLFLLQQEEILLLIQREILLLQQQLLILDLQHLLLVHVLDVVDQQEVISLDLPAVHCLQPMIPLIS